MNFKHRNMIYIPLYNKLGYPRLAKALAPGAAPGNMV